MELISHKIDQEEVYIAPCGDFQWAGVNGSTAQEHAKSYIKEVTGLGGYFIGLGDYIDFLSPSNRQRLKAAGLYDTAGKVIEEAAAALVNEFYTKFLVGTENKWLGLTHGHHYYEFADGSTTDTWLADQLKAPYLGTSAMVKVTYGTKLQHSATIFCHHGVGSGSMPHSGLNKLYHTAQSWDVDFIVMGHNTKLASTVMSRQHAVWTGSPDLVHKDIRLVNSGGFSKSSNVNNMVGKRPHGDYAEEKMLGPAPLAAPIIHLRSDGSFRVII